MTNEEAIPILHDMYNYYNDKDVDDSVGYAGFDVEDNEALEMAIKCLKQKTRKGQWLRMSDLSEQEDDRYKCSWCGNVIHHKNEMDLYTFNSWCGRCGSDNGRHINYEVLE